MKQKLVLIMFLAILLGMFTSAWADVTIGSGTATNSNLPINTNYGYNYSQQIYTQAQIGAAITINAIKFYKSSGTITNSGDWVVYMGHTTKTTFSTTTDWVPLASMTQVFSGVVTFPSAEGWYEVTLSTPFVYNNTDNIVIAVDENTPSYGTSYSHRVFTSGTYTGIYYRSDSTNPNPSSPPSASSRVATINQIQLITPSLTPPNAAVTPSPADAANMVSITPTLSWVNGGGGPTGYKVFFGETLPGTPNVDQTGTSWAPGTLNYSTTYQWKVVPYNANGDCETGITTWSFTTGPDPVIVDYPSYQSFDDTAYPPYGWTHVLTSGTTGWQRSTGSSNPTLTPYAGAGMLYYNSYNMNVPANASLISPPLNADSATHMYKVKFWMYRDGYANYLSTADKVEVYTNTTQSLTGATLVGTVNRSYTLAPVEAAEGWYEYTFELGVGGSGNLFAILKAVSAYGDNMNVDEVTFDRTELGGPPNPATSPNPANSATLVAINTNLSWASGGGAPTGYKIYLSQDEDPQDVVGSQAETTLDMVDNLQFGKTYYWKVDPYNDFGYASEATTLPIWTFSTATGVAITPSPANSATAQDATNRVLNWADVAGATGYRVIAGTSSGNNDLVNMAEVTESQYTHPTNWPFSTQIWWTVYTLNGEQEIQGTEWTFTTGENPVLTPPTVQDFTTFPPTNWTRWSGLMADPISLTTSTSGWVADGFANVGSSGAAKINIYGTTYKYWLISPPIDLGGKMPAGYNLVFDLALTDYGSVNPITSDPNGTTGIDDKFAVLISTDGTTWTTANILRLWDNAGSANVYNNISATGETVSIDLSAYSGIVKIAFYGESTASNADNDLFVDNFQVIQAGAPPTAPTTFTPANSATNVAINTNLSWSGAGGSPTGYKVYFGADPGTLDMISDQPASPYLSTGNLLFNTPYYWYVAAYNENGSSDSETVTFTTATGVAITPVPATETTNYAPTLTTLDWADVAGATGYKIVVGTTSGASDIANMVECATSSWTKPSNWAYGQIYYWTVYTLNGAQEVQGTEWSFTVGQDPTITTLPYSEGFNAVTFPPYGWSNYSVVKETGAYSPTGYWTRKTTGTYNSTSGAAFISYNYSSTSWACLQLPEINLPAKAKLSYYWRDNDSKLEAQDTTYCEISTNGGTTWINLATLSPAATQSTYQKVEVPLDAYAGNGRLIRFKDSTNATYSAWGSFVDELTIEEYFDYPADTPVVIGEETITVTGGSANNTTGQIPPISNGIFVASGSYILSLVGAGPWTITIQTLAPWGAYYQAGSWHSVENVGGFITFVINPSKDETVPIVLGDGDPTLPVELSSFTATLTSDLMVKIAWVAESETNHSGYNVMRAEARDLSAALQLNPVLISDGTEIGSQIRYNYTDQEAFSNMIYYYWLESVALDGTSQFFGPLTITIGDPTQEPLPPVVPLATKLLNAYPNPFNPNTNIRYTMKEAGKVSIDIYNTKGQKVRSFKAEHNAPGYYQINWDGRDASGNSVASGIYMYRMNSGKYNAAKKMILAK